MDFPAFHRREPCGKYPDRWIEWPRRFGTRGLYISERPALPTGHDPQRHYTPAESPAVSPAPAPGHPTPGSSASPTGTDPLLSLAPVIASQTPPRIALYHDAQSPPQVVTVPIPVGLTGAAAPPGTADPVGLLIETLTTKAHGLAREQGSIIPAGVLRELVDNLVHAAFAGVVITILDGGNTIRVSDHGPGIPDKEAALRPGFTSAGPDAKHYIKGVGSGFPVVRETLSALGGSLAIEDNLGRGTVVTARVPPPAETPLAPAPAPAYNLPERQLKVLLLTVELAPVGPTRIAEELGVSTSTAYRDLVSLEEAGFVVCRPSGHRSATDAGLAYLGTVL